MFSISVRYRNFLCLVPYIRCGAVVSSLYDSVLDNIVSCLLQRLSPTMVGELLAYVQDFI